MARNTVRFASQNIFGCVELPSAIVRFAVTVLDFLISKTESIVVTDVKLKREMGIFSVKGSVFTTLTQKAATIINCS